MAKDILTIDDLTERLGRNEVAALYLLFGEEDFLIDDGLKAIIQSALGKSERGFNLDVVSAGERDIREILAIASSFPMMADRRVVVVRDAEKITGKDADVLTGYCENPSRTTSLVLITTKPDFRKRPYSVLKRNGVVVESKSLYENQLPGWITSRVQRKGKTIHPEACKLLTAYVGPPLREMQNELDKLFVFIGDRNEITTDDVSSVVGMSKEYSVFELQRAIGTKDVARAVEIIHYMVEGGQSVPFVVVMLTNYFTAFWKLHEMRRKGVPPREQASAARIHPYFFQEYAESVSRFSQSEVERAFVLLAHADEQAKSTSLGVSQILTTLVVNLLGEVETAIPV